jgi:hypothetical protein
MDSLYLASGGAQLEVRKQRAQENQANRELDIRQQSANDDSRRSYLEELATKQQIEARSFDLQMKQKEDLRRRQQAEIANTLFNSDRGQRLTAEGEDDDTWLASKYTEMAKKLAGTDPITSNEYFTKAQEAKQKALLAAKNGLEVKEQRLEQVGLIASGVFDQQSVLEAQKELAKVGKRVPEEALDWNNPNAKDWWKRQTQFSKTAVAASKIELEERKFQSLTEDRKADNERADKALANEDRKLAMARDKITASRKLTNPKSDTLMSTIAFMDAQDANFASAPKEIKLTAARDIESLTLQYMQQSNMSQQEAAELARKQVAGQIDENGKYNVLSEYASKNANSTDEWKAKLGTKYKPGYRYWIENGRIKGEPL